MALSWFRSYLYGRTQKVFFDGFLSKNICELSCGVPQGSILGPLLYLIYVNDCFKCLDNSCSILYADDTTLVITARSYDLLYKFINSDLSKLYDWLCLNKLTVNESKTKYMTFSISGRTNNPPSHLNITLNNTIIERVQNYKFLGMTINENLNWKNHMLELHSKIQRNLGIVRKTARFLNRHSLIQLYHSLIMSHIRKGIIVWYHGNVALKKKIQACANKFLRLIYYLKPRDSVREIMKENKFLSVNQIYNIELAKIMQKNALGSLPTPLKLVFQGQTRQTQIQSRSATNIIPAATRFTKCDQAIRCTGPTAWNNIPYNIRYFSNDDLSNPSGVPLPMGPFVSKLKNHALSAIDFI